MPCISDIILWVDSIIAIFVSPSVFTNYYNARYFRLTSLDNIYLVRVLDFYSIW